MQIDFAPGCICQTCFQGIEAIQNCFAWKIIGESDEQIDITCLRIKIIPGLGPENVKLPNLMFFADLSNTVQVVSDDGVHASIIPGPGENTSPWVG